MKIHPLFIILGLSLCLPIPEVAFSQRIDITALVKAKNPRFEQEVQNICEESCLGNRRKGWLHAISYTKIDDRNYQLHVEARFQNRHHTGPVYFLGMEVVERGDIYNHTVIVKAKGKIDKRTCIAVLEDIGVENDYGDIFTSLVNRETIRGKTTTFDECAEYLK